MRTCEFCTNLYTPKRKDQRYCSNPCRTEGHRADSRAYYQRNVDRVKEVVRRYRRENAPVIAERSKAKYQLSREDILEQKKTYWLENQDAIKDYRRRNAAALEASRKEYVRRNRDRIAVRTREYRERNAERRAQQARAWRQANREACRILDQRKRARKAANASQVTLKDWQRLLNRHSGRCAYCQASGDLHMDHVVPLSRGGRHSIGNVLPACPSCNLSKSWKLLAEWRYRRIVKVAS